MVIVVGLLYAGVLFQFDSTKMQVAIGIIFPAIFILGARPGLPAPHDDVCVGNLPQAAQCHLLPHGLVRAGQLGQPDSPGHRRQ